MLFRRDKKRPSTPPPEPELLGTVTAPSGDLVLVDFGLLRLWSGDATPFLDPALVPEDVADAANRCEDVELVGLDADAAAALLDLAAVKGRYGFDFPAGGGALAERLAELRVGRGLTVELRSLGRVAHRERVRMLLDDVPHGAEVPFDGGWAVAVRGVPRDRPLRVLGTRMSPDGPDQGRWHAVWVELAPGEVVAWEEVGVVLVDEARLMWADPDALTGFRSDESVDGLADLAVWGRDGDEIAAEIGARPLDGEQGVHAVVDQPVARVVELAERLAARQADPDVWFRFDLRPHDDHFRVLAQMRASVTESGTIDVDGMRVTGLFTTWGDGAYPVQRGLAADGTTLRVRVELGAPEIVTRTRRLEELWFGPLSELAMVSARITSDGAPVGWLYREATDRQDDSGWHVLAGDESQDYLDDPSHAGLVPLRELLQVDPELEALFRTPAPVAYERSAGGGFTEIDVPPDPE